MGQWRIEDLDATTATPSDVLSNIAKTKPNVIYESPLSMDPKCLQHLDVNRTLVSQGLGHGSMIHAKVDPTTTVTVNNAATPTKATSEDNSSNNAEGGGTTTNGAMKRIIAADGSIQLTAATGEDASNPNGFRKGMLPLRDMKMSWTLQVRIVSCIVRY